MVRGGSFNNNRNNVRCAYRNNNNPDNRNENIGFRVVSHGFQPPPNLPRSGGGAVDGKSLDLLPPQHGEGWGWAQNSAPATACAARMEAGAAGSWPSYPHPTSPAAGKEQLTGNPLICSLPSLGRAGEG